MWQTFDPLGKKCNKDTAISTKRNKMNECCMTQCTVCSKMSLIDRQMFCCGHSCFADCTNDRTLTVHSDAPLGSLSTDGVAGSAGVLCSITALCRDDYQRVTGDGDPCVRTDGCTSLAPLDRNLCPSRPCTPQRHISSLHRYCGGWQTDPCYCVYRKRKKRQKNKKKIAASALTCEVAMTA